MREAAVFLSPPFFVTETWAQDFLERTARTPVLVSESQAILSITSKRCRLAPFCVGSLSGAPRCISTFVEALAMARWKPANSVRSFAGSPL